MKRSDLVLRVRALTRDFSGSIFRQQDILDFINEGIDRCKQLMKELDGMVWLNGDDESPVLLPSAYHSLLAVYATARCFGQDERHYQAQTYMNEFETKFDEFKTAVEEGRVSIVDALGNPVVGDNSSFYVEDNYFSKNTSDSTEQFDYPLDPDLVV
jgi:hypothetical protein